LLPDRDEDVDTDNHRMWLSIDYVSSGYLGCVVQAAIAGGFKY